MSNYDLATVLSLEIYKSSTLLACWYIPFMVSKIGENLTRLAHFITVSTRSLN